MMESDELLELKERTERGGDRRIGLTMAIFAAGLAMVTLMGHRDCDRTLLNRVTDRNATLLASVIRRRGAGPGNGCMRLASTPLLTR